MAVFAVLIGAIHLPPFLTSPIAMWGWQNWWFGFAPAAYLVFAAVVAVSCEWWRPRLGTIMLPIVHCPLLLITGLILFACYLDLGNAASGKYTWSQNLCTLLIVSLCPVVWYYSFISLVRSIRLLKSNQGAVL
ncbi:MAG: hypothetical protein WBD31_15525 [Rubripirellula sp.]